MKVPTQDHGTWRRIAVIDYMSKFTENPEPDEDEPYQFLKDTKLSDRFHGKKYLWLCWWK